MDVLGKLVGSPKLRSAVAKMIEDAKSTDEERRDAGRYPYFQPVLLQLDDNPELYSAFTRDISLSGLGLLHWMPIRPQVITLVGKLNDGPNLRLRLKIVWCVPCGEGWYISGGRFLELDGGDETVL